jgi:hypothetical protein
MSGGYSGASVGVIRSKDYGQNWTVINEGLPWPFAWTIEVDPGNSSFVFMGSPGSGIQKRQFSDLSGIFIIPHPATPLPLNSVDFINLSINPVYDVMGRRLWSGIYPAIIRYSALKSLP